MVGFVKWHHSQLPSSHDLLFYYLLNSFFDCGSWIHLNSDQLGNQLRISLYWDRVILLQLLCKILIVSNETIMEDGNSVLFIHVRMSQDVLDLLGWGIPWVKNSKVTLQHTGCFERLLHLVEAVLFQWDRSCPVPVYHVLLMAKTVVFISPLIFPETSELPNVYLLSDCSTCFTLFLILSLISSDRYTALMIRYVLQEMSLAQTEVKSVLVPFLRFLIFWLTCCTNIG